MRERAAVWSARLVLLALALVPLYSLSFISVRWLYGWPFTWQLHTYNLFQTLLVIVVYAISAILAVTAFVLMCVLLGESWKEVKFGFRTLWAIAWRHPHEPWKERRNNEYMGPDVTYKTPQPLMRGRMGSR